MHTGSIDIRLALLLIVRLVTGHTMALFHHYRHSNHTHTHTQATIGTDRWQVSQAPPVKQGGRSNNTNNNDEIVMIRNLIEISFEDKGHVMFQLTRREGPPRLLFPRWIGNGDHPAVRWLIETLFLLSEMPLLLLLVAIVLSTIHPKIWIWLGRRN